MKIPTANKDLNYSLHNNENYKTTIDCDIGAISSKYAVLLSEYYKFIIENIKVKNASLSRFIITRGLDTITNVFNSLLFYTKNIDLTYFHCQKSFYFYVEFVGQISEDEKMFLQLTSRDAATYVYKKTLFEINNDRAKLNQTLTPDTKNKIDIINVYINLYRTYLQKIINSDSRASFDSFEIFEKICLKLNGLSNKTKIFVLENIVDKLFHRIEDVDAFFAINEILVKKFIKNQEEGLHIFSFKTPIYYGSELTIL